MKLYFGFFFALLKAVKTSTTLKWHIFSILVEAIGTLFVWLDTARLDARSPDTGFTLGDPRGYHAWWYHCGLWGFGFLFLGILLQAALIFSRDAELESIDKRIKDLETLAQQKESQAKSIQNEASDSWSI
jgi:hypothetical protein